VWVSLLRCKQNAASIQAKQNAEVMDRNRIDHNKPVFDHLHPKIYATAIGLVAWFVLAAWVFLRSPVRRAKRGVIATHDDDRAALRSCPASLVAVAGLATPPDAARGRFTKNVILRLERWRFRGVGSKVHGAHAAINMLLPPAAAAFGLTAIGIVFLIEAGLAN
jgi:hypothetical protein